MVFQDQKRQDFQTTQFVLLTNAIPAVQKMLEKERCLLGEDLRLGVVIGKERTRCPSRRDCAKLGKYTVQNGIAMAEKHFKQLNLSESKVHYFRDKYVRICMKCQSWRFNRVDWIPRSSNTSSVYVTMGLQSTSLLSKQMLKAIYSVVTTLCCYMLLI